MKKIIFIAIILVFTSILSAQAQIPVSNNTNTWIFNTDTRQTVLNDWKSPWWLFATTIQINELMLNPDDSDLTPTASPFFATAWGLDVNGVVADLHPNNNLSDFDGWKLMTVDFSERLQFYC